MGKPMFSFHLQTFWFHLRHQEGNIWIDQHSERWFFYNGWFRHEDGVMAYNFFKEENNGASNSNASQTTVATLQ